MKLTIISKYTYIYFVTKEYQQCIFKNHHMTEQKKNFVLRKQVDHRKAAPNPQKVDKYVMRAQAY